MKSKPVDRGNDKELNKRGLYQAIKKTNLPKPQEKMNHGKKQKEITPIALLWYYAWF